METTSTVVYPEGFVTMTNCGAAATQSAFRSTASEVQNHIDSLIPRQPHSCGADTTSKDYDHYAVVIHYLQRFFLC